MGRQAAAVREHSNASREVMDKLEHDSKMLHEDTADLYIELDGEVAICNSNNNQQYTLNDSYYASDTNEEEPRKEKNQHTAFAATPKRRLKATSIGHSGSHEHADSQMTNIYNIDHLESVYTAAGMHDRFLLDKSDKKEMITRRPKIQNERLESRRALMLEDPKSESCQILLVRFMKMQSHN